MNKTYTELFIDNILFPLCVIVVVAYAFCLLAYPEIDSGWKKAQIRIATVEEKVELAKYSRKHGPILYAEEEGFAVRLTGPNKGQVIRIKEK